MRKLLDPDAGQMTLFEAPVRTPALFEEWEPGVVMLTPNRRLARTLLQQFDVTQLQAGHQVWERPKIYAWDEWLEQLWLEHGQWTSSQQLLTPELEALLWEDLVTSSGLVDTRAAARMAAAAHALTVEYGVPEQDPTFLNEDQRTFLLWQEQYRARLEQMGMLDRHRLGSLLLDMCRRGQVPQPSQIRWVAFDRLSPLQRCWMETLNVLGCTQHTCEAVQRKARAVRLASTDSAAELRLAVGWLAQKLRRKPQQKLGLVVPDLASQRALLETLLEEAIPERKLYNLSLGKPLASCALVRTACCALQLLRSQVAFEEISAVLRSPYLGASTAERPERALWEAALRQRHLATGSLTTYLCNERPNEVAADFRGRLQQVDELRTRAPERDTPAAWANLIQQTLQCLYWPGSRTLNSAEHQTAERMLECVGRLLAVQPLAATMTLDQAVDFVQRTLRETLFQPESNSVAPLQVLGLLEAAGLEFDAVWVTGLTDQAWPALGRANPFLPLDVQRKLGMPHSSPEQDLEFAARVTRRLLEAAPIAVWSYPTREQDRHLRPSRLIAALPVVEAADLGAEPVARPARAIFEQRPQLELWEDEQGPALLPDELARGGSSIFKLQAACAFRAFAQLRLRAEALEPVAPGLLASERGTLVHRVLELVWAELEGSEALRGANLPDVCARAAQRAVGEFASRRPDILSGRFGKLEERRLAGMAVRWLELEKQRQLPFRVVAREQRQTVELFGLRFTTIVDRIDLVDDKMLLLLDYKTGDTHTDSWYGERPDEPQLPLYVVGSEQPVDGLAFASLKPPHFRFSGNCSDPRAFPRAMPADDPEVLRSQWHDVLAKLADEFRSGHAAIAPKQPQRTCQHCRLSGFCRVGQREETV
jgi:ATP-dependent helicase/nuclease subunit B